MHKILLIGALLCGCVIWSQDIVCSAADRNAFSNKITEIEGLQDQASGALLVNVGKTFLGTPYLASTLEIGEVEKLVVNLSGLDCTTFVENVLAFSILIREKETSFDRYTQVLEQIRYRDGQLSGYPSRLHYFSEWIEDNQKKGLVKDVTAELGGIPSGKIRNFMTSHRDLYPRLSDSETFSAMKTVEQNLEKEDYYYVPSAILVSNIEALQHGDIIALATNINGLDVTHTGIVFRTEDGVPHLLHASSKGSVEISEKPLLEYLAGVKGNTGILVARPTF